MNEVKQVPYLKALKANLAYAAVYLTAVLLLLYVISPLDTIQKYLLFSLAVVGAGAAINSLIRASAKSVLCQHCSAELYFQIEQAKNMGLGFKFCPACGGKVED